MTQADSLIQIFPGTYSQESSGQYASLFYIGHLYFSARWQGLSLMMVIEVGLCAQNMKSTLGSIVNTIKRAYVIPLKRKETFNLTSYNFCISILILKFNIV